MYIWEKRENKDYLVFGFEEVAEVCLNDDVKPK